MSREEANRSERVPFGIKRSKMAVKDTDPNYVYRWINDTPGRLEDAQRGGYAFVTEAKAGEKDVSNRNQDLGSRVSRVVGRDANGKPETAYLMRIQKAMYKADQEVKQRELDDLDKAIKRGQTRPVEQGYVPTQGISVTTKTED